MIHCREAEADVVRMLRAEFDKHGPIRAVMHSFSGDLATARACLEMGLYISFAGMVTYPNAQNLRDVAKEVPLERLLVETDCPYLAPQPVRGKRNEPAYVAHTAAVLAEVKGVSARGDRGAHDAERPTALRRLNLNPGQLTLAPITSSTWGRVGDSCNVEVTR